MILVVKGKVQLKFALTIPTDMPITLAQEAIDTSSSWG